jgi:chromosome segregation ATPase
VGESSECPHCFDPIEVPHADTINKDKFVEPPGLRRILNQVRDREWEHMRRKLRAAKAQINQLEAQLDEAKASLAVAETSVAPAAEEADSLRRQLGDVTEKFSLANQAFTAGRKQHDSALEKLRRDLELSREEVQVLQKRHDALRASNEDLEDQLKIGSAVGQEMDRLKADLEWARGEVTDLRQQLAKAQAEHEAEKAKVFLMEAAAVGAAAATSKPAEAGPTEPSQAPGNAAEAELRSQLAELQKRCNSIQAVRDKAQADLAEARAQLAAREQEEGGLETALTELESDIKEVVWAISSRRERKAS